MIYDQETWTQSLTSWFIFGELNWLLWLISLKGEGFGLCLKNALHWLPDWSYLLAISKLWWVCLCFCTPQIPSCNNPLGPSFLILRLRGSGGGFQLAAPRVSREAGLSLPIHPIFLDTIIGSRMETWLNPLENWSWGFCWDYRSKNSFSL